MNYKLQLIVFVIVFVIVCSSCDNHHSSNGKLDGFWQMTNLEYYGNYKKAYLYNLPMYWAVQVDLLNIRHEKDRTGLWFRFKQTKDSLIISEPYINNRDSSDIKITEAALLYPYGIYHLREGFAIESLSNSAMILKSDSVRLAFRKY